MWRERPLLTTGSLPCEPYHRAKGHAAEAAEAIVRAAIEEAQTLAARAANRLIGELRGRGCELVAAGIVLGSGRAEFTLSQALSTHAAMHNAEGWLYREALMRASEECGLRVVGALEASVYTEAAAQAGVPPDKLEARVAEFRQQVGPPWTRDQKLASAAAWLGLAQASRPR